jgi:general secretion pathway protein C
VATVAQALHLDGELVGQLIARAPRWITALLVVLLGIRAATLVAGLAGGSPAPAAEPVRPAPVRNVVDIPSILRANLFGQSPPAAGTAPVTSMALVLGGVIADVDEKRGFAMLGTSPTTIKFYRVGETVPGGARLHAVMVDRVLLDRGGTIETLLLPSRINPAAAPSLTGPAPPVQSAQRVQQLIRDNPALINQVIQRTPVLAEGRLRGIRVYPGSNAQAFSKLGLRPGDMVTAINGTTLEGQTRPDEIFNTLSNAAEARVTVIRNNSPLDLQLNLAEVASEAERLSANPPPPDGVPPPGAPESAR